VNGKASFKERSIDRVKTTEGISREKSLKASSAETEVE
jgi:hypothetical protein